MVRINVELDEQTHKNWEKHVEEDNRYSSISQLVRFAVGEQIDRDNGDYEPEGSVEIDEGKISAIVDEKVTTVKNDVQSLSNDIVGVQRVMQSLTDEDAYLSLAMDIHDIIPQASGPSELFERSGVESGRVDHIAHEIRDEQPDISDEEVRIAAERLRHDVPQVKVEDVQGDRYIYEEVSG